MGELRSVLDALAVEELKPMFGPQLLDRAAELLQARNRIDAELIRTVRECELTQASEIDGLKTMASWLRGHARLSPGAAAGVGLWTSHRTGGRRAPPPLRSRLSTVARQGLRRICGQASELGIRPAEGS